MARGWSGAFLGILALSVVACTSTTAVQPEPDGGSDAGAGGDSAGGGGEELPAETRGSRAKAAPPRGPR